MNLIYKSSFVSQLTAAFRTTIIWRQERRDCTQYYVRLGERVTNGEDVRAGGILVPKEFKYDFNQHERIRDFVILAK